MHHHVNQDRQIRLKPEPHAGKVQLKSTATPEEESIEQTQ
jgi:hypothetical protein